VSATLSTLRQSKREEARSGRIDFKESNSLGNDEWLSKTLFVELQQRLALAAFARARLRWGAPFG
jgi:hypothetical protein